MFGPQALTQEGYLANPETYAAMGPGGQGAGLSELYDACLRAVGQAAVTGTSQGLWEALTGYLRSALTAILTTEQAGLGQIGPSPRPHRPGQGPSRPWDRTGSMLNARRPATGGRDAAANPASAPGTVF